ncbi:pyridoxal 5'-phosphate synthase glutaminase subunit PdxT [Jeotgalibacillus sp. R-1-5s-1]|uniref:pyridoxal 5'-phosphate synthase glutaminase subunit PdxT n=1 Tax=Jeotgalibacillus sp. R-1-5s-1 TaxID=2555897 RepID=UPI00106C08CD|nr:pyridoxal 5'-phosphate synthase glutaminase subunit PdxT [Jeotgalibacillus sp. R-1-5s-1]TFD96281.1 pyridoxal 5'-phosphate synthase glutaminase subunit PdxT [Jeotgalibacillus sp. R-1-5s-1]
MTTVGVLGLQGAVREHFRSIEAGGAKAVVVKKAEQLSTIDGLIIPGGESTTMRRLIDVYGLMEPLRHFAASGKPIFGTCAGLILLAGEIVGYDEPHLGVMDVVVERNSFGRQKESFETDLSIKGIEGDPFTAVFIRAPHIVSAGPETEVLATYKDRIVLARHGQFLGCSFHPELTDDHRLTEYFISMVKSAGVTA